MSGFNPWCARIPRPKKKRFAPRGSSFLVGGLSLGCLSPVKRSAMSFSRSGRYAGLTTTWCLRIGSLRESCRYSRNRGKASSSMIAWPLSSAIFVVPEGHPIFRQIFCSSHCSFETDFLMSLISSTKKRNALVMLPVFMLSACVRSCWQMPSDASRSLIKSWPNSCALSQSVPPLKDSRQKKSLWTQ